MRGRRKGFDRKISETIAKIDLLKEITLENFCISILYKGLPRLYRNAMTIYAELCAPDYWNFQDLTNTRLYDITWKF